MSTLEGAVQLSRVPQETVQPAPLTRSILVEEYVQLLHQYDSPVCGTLPIDAHSAIARGRPSYRELETPLSLSVGIEYG